MIVVNYGGGLNSTALIVEAITRGIKIDYVIFADTGSEKPATYTFVDVFRRWLATYGVEIVTVRWIREKGKNKGRFIAIHEQCLERHEFPSVTYGLKGCTSKWKQQPIDKWVRELLRTVPADVPVERWLGYDPDEPERWEPIKARPQTERWVWRAPLVEWDMGRVECRTTILNAGLPLPPKSSCFVCRNMRPAEIKDLEVRHPETMSIALEIERRALKTLKKKGSIAGLGGTYSWEEARRQADMFCAPGGDFCISCWDGD